MRIALLLIVVVAALAWTSALSSGRTVWVEKGEIIDGRDVYDYTQGSLSLSADGLTIAQGAPDSSSGLVRVFKQIDGKWTQIGDSLHGVADSLGNLGDAVDLSADGAILAVGAPMSNKAEGMLYGLVRVYGSARDGWIQLGGDIYGTSEYERAGDAVSLSADGTIVAVGSSRFPDGGRVRVFQYLDRVWRQIGHDIKGEGSGGYLYHDKVISLSADGMTLAHGSAGVDGYGDQSGQVKVYHFDGHHWVQLGADIEGEQEGARFGAAVSLNADGTILAVGAPWYTIPTSSNHGLLRIYRYDSQRWMQIGQDIYARGDTQLGEAVSLNGAGTVVAAGAPSASEHVGEWPVVLGKAEVYRYSTGGSWIPVGNHIKGNRPDSRFGTFVCLSGDGLSVAVGGPGAEGNPGYIQLYSAQEGERVMIPAFETLLRSRQD